MVGGKGKHGETRTRPSPMTSIFTNKFNNNDNEGPRIPQLSFPVILSKNDSSDSVKDEEVIHSKEYSIIRKQQIEHMQITVKTIDQEDEVDGYESSKSHESSGSKIDQENEHAVSSKDFPSHTGSRPMPSLGCEDSDDDDDVSVSKKDQTFNRVDPFQVATNESEAEFTHSDGNESYKSSRSNSAQSSAASKKTSEESNENFNEIAASEPNSSLHSFNDSEADLSIRLHVSDISAPDSPEPNENTFTSAISPELPETHVEDTFVEEPPKKILPVNSLRKCSIMSAKTRESILKCTNLLDSKEWEDIINGLKLVHILLEDPSTNISGWRTITRSVSNQVRCLRSQVARAACNTSGSIFETHGKFLESEAEDLLVPLLDRTADTNRFLRADATDALEKICNNINNGKALSLILTKGCSHRSGVVRGASAQLLLSLVSKVGVTKVLSMPRELRDRLLRANVDQLTDAMPETRARAKDLMRLLATEEHFITILKESIPQTKFKSIEKTIRAIRT